MMFLCAEIGQKVDQRVEIPCVDGSSPSLGTASAVLHFTLPASSGPRGTSSIGRASALHVEGCGFNSHVLHAVNSVAAAASPPVIDGRVADVVQTAEQRFRKSQVAGAIPVVGPVEMTGLTTTATNERVAERLGTSLQNWNNMGPTPIAFSGRIESRECSRTVVELATTPARHAGKWEFESPLSCRARRQDVDITFNGCAWKLVGDAPARKARVPSTAVNGGITRYQRVEKQLSQRRLYCSV